MPSVTDELTPICISQNIYITGASQGSGKSLIMLAMMEMLTGHVGKVSFFRPIIPSSSKRDELIELISKRYQLTESDDMMYGCDMETARQLLDEDRYDELLKIILEKYRALKARNEHILCVGTDYSRGTSSFAVEFNIDVARNLDCLMLPVIQGVGRDYGHLVDVVATLKHALQENDCPVLATVINGVDATVLPQLTAHFSHAPEAEFPVYVVPLETELEKPSIANIAHHLSARILSGSPNSLSREVAHYKIAAMLVPDFLDCLENGDLIIAPCDRIDIVLACLVAHQTKTHPNIAGLLLTGQPLAPQMFRLLEGLHEPPFAVLSVPTDTFTAAIEVSQVSGSLSAIDNRKIAAALGLVEKHIDMGELRQRLCRNVVEHTTPLMFEYDLLQRARSKPQHIVLPEGNEERILRAAEILLLRHVVTLTLLGNEQEIRQKIQSLGLKLDSVAIIDPQRSPLREHYARTYTELRKHKGMVCEIAYDLMADVSYFGTMMVHLGHADGMVSGAVHSTQHTIRPAFEIIKAKPGVSIISSVFFMCLADRVLVYGDCAVNPEPNAEELADIAISSAETAKMFNIEPRVAMLSYSTGESGKGEAVDKVREATQIAKTKRPDLKLEGPIQYDAAVDAEVAKTKLPDSEVAGRATVLIFPDLNTGNNTYKAVQRSSGAIAVGPVLQGLNKPVNDLSRGCTVTDIVNTVIITAIQAQEN